MSDHTSSPAGKWQVVADAADSGPQPRWYAVQCQPHCELKAAANLGNQDFAVFLPRRQKMRRHARKVDMVLAPFFPGYLFVELDLTRQRWRSINGTYGVGHLVMNGEVPAPAPRGVIEALRGACDENGVLHLAGDELKPGQSVRILVGAFADFIGEIDRLDGAGRVRVLLDIMGGRIPVVLQQDNLERTESGR